MIGVRKIFKLYISKKKKLIDQTKTKKTHKYY